MNSNYLGQQFQLDQNAPRARTETPIHPPQIPSQAAAGRSRQQQQQYNAQNVQQSQQASRPPLGPPTAPHHGYRLPPQPDLTAQLQAQRDLEHEMAGRASIEPVYHRAGDAPHAPMHPSRPKPRTQNPQQYAQFNMQAQQAQQAQQMLQNLSPQYGSHGVLSGAIGRGTSHGPQARQQQQPQGQDQEPDPSSQLHNESVQGLREEVFEEQSDSDMEDANDGDGENTGFNTSPSTGYVAPLVQVVTELQLPKVRPTLMLGPYEKREDAMNTVQEYAISQGYVLVQTGCARQKTPGGKYTGESEVVRVDLMCDRGGLCKNSGTGQRKRPTHKIGCPTRIKLVCRKRQASKWFIEIRCEQHNHDLDPTKMHLIASYRRWRRVQAGGPAMEPLKDRHERNRKPKVMPPVPPPKFHQVGGIGAQPPPNPTSPLHMAALKGQCKIIEILLNKGADINNLDQTGRTPLHCAVEGERMDAVKVLVERGADVTIKDAKGISALQMAVEKGMEDAVVLFIENGADPNQ